MADFNNALINGLLTSTGIANAYKTFAKTPAEVENLRQHAALRGSQTRYHDSRADENIRKAQLLEQVLSDPSRATNVAQAYYATSGKAPFTNANVKGAALNQLTGEQPVGNPDAFFAELENMKEMVALNRARSQAAIASAGASRASAANSYASAAKTKQAMSRERNQESVAMIGGQPVRGYQQNGVWKPYVDERGNPVVAASPMRHDPYGPGGYGGEPPQQPQTFNDDREEYEFARQQAIASGDMGMVNALDSMARERGFIR